MTAMTTIGYGGFEERQFEDGPRGQQVKHEKGEGLARSKPKERSQKGSSSSTCNDKFMEFMMLMMEGMTELQKENP